MRRRARTGRPSRPVGRSEAAERRPERGVSPSTGEVAALTASDTPLRGERRGRQPRGPRARRRAVRREPAAGGGRGDRLGPRAVGHRRDRPRPGRRRVRRPDGDPHRRPVRGERRPGRHRRDDLGGQAARDPRGRQPHQAAGPDHAAGGRGDRADQPQRGGGGAPADAAGRGGPAGHPAVQAADAARVRGQRGVAAAADRQPGQRHRVRGRGGGGRGTVRVRRVRAGRCAAGGGHHARGAAGRRPAAARPGRRRGPAGPQRPGPHPHPAIPARQRRLPRGARGLTAGRAPPRRVGPVRLPRRQRRHGHRRGRRADRRPTARWPWATA